MSADILRFPGMPEEDTRERHQKTKGYLADYLRAVASMIDMERIDSEPWAIHLVLTGDDVHEVVHLGHNRDTLEGVRVAVNNYGVILREGRVQDNQIKRREFEKATDKELPAIYWKNNGHGFVE